MKKPKEEYWYNTDLINSTADQALCKLWMVVVVCVLFIIAEVVGGVIANSLAILSDAVHLGSDLFGFFISIVAIQLSKKKATQAYSYGFMRIEIMGALSSALLIVVLSFWLIYESISRMATGVEAVKPWFMFGTACFGLVCNLSMMKVLHGSGHSHDGHDHGDGHGHDHGHSHGHSHGPAHGEKGHVHSKDEEAHDHKHEKPHDHEHKHDHGDEHKDEKVGEHEHEELSKAKVSENANIQAAMVHVIGDIIQSIGVILASVVILIWPQASIVDPICTLIFAIGVLFTVTKIFKTYFRILMEGTPDSVDYFAIKQGILELFDDIINVEDLHIWSITQGKMAATVHMELSCTDNCQLILLSTTLFLRSHGIYHTTIQLECPSSLEIEGEIDCNQDIHGTVQDTKTQKAKLKES